jgi:hypothetical protein
MLLAASASLVAAQAGGASAGGAGSSQAAPRSSPQVAPESSPQAVHDAGPAKPGSMNPGNISPGNDNPGNISGIVVDQDGAVISGAAVTLTQTQVGSSQACISAGDGWFHFSNVAAGGYDIRIVAAGFAPLKQSGSLGAGEWLTLPPLQLAVGATIQVEAAETQEQIATEQIHEQERQRLLGVVPNFYVSYEKHPMPLTSRQKFQLAWKSSIDPVQFGINGVTAGIQQSVDAFSGYGRGAQGYAKRFGADTADTWVGTFLGGAILPSLLKQDPRYLYKGTGSKPSRFFYAVASVFICRGDNWRWQPNYSNLLGSLGAGAISNLYYPASNRQGLGLTFENTAIGLGGSAFSAVLQEFLLKHVTPHTPDKDLPQN